MNASGIYGHLVQSTNDYSLALLVLRQAPALLATRSPSLAVRREVVSGRFVSFVICRCWHHDAAIRGLSAGLLTLAALARGVWTCRGATFRQSGTRWRQGQTTCTRTSWPSTTRLCTRFGPRLPPHPSPAYHFSILCNLKHLICALVVSLCCARVNTGALLAMSAPRYPHARKLGAPQLHSRSNHATVLDDGAGSRCRIQAALDGPTLD